MGKTVKKAVVLLSGGLDSAVTLALARRDGYNPHALTVDYGQRHRIEIQRAEKVAEALGAVEHKVLAVNLRAFGGSALTSELAVPKARASLKAGGIPSTYVPARNTIFLSLALAWAEVLKARALFIGANAVDYSGYPDCRPEYFEAYQRLALLATKGGVQEGWKLSLETPLLYKSKAEIIRLGKELGVDFSLTLSCYHPNSDGTPCGVCESCRLRQKGFAEAGVKDPQRG
jgi:7-cyano-7-deazaguanine synthase